MGPNEPTSSTEQLEQQVSKGVLEKIYELIDGKKQQHIISCSDTHTHIPITLRNFGSGPFNRF